MSGRVNVGCTAVALLRSTGVKDCPSAFGICSHLYDSAPMLKAPLRVTLLPRSTVCAAPARAVTTSATVTRTGTVSFSLRPVSPMATSENSYCPGGAVKVSFSAVGGLVRVTPVGAVHS
jgi:hypothetical protein